MFRRAWSSLQEILIMHAILALGFLCFVPLLLAQSENAEWQKVAGGKVSFDVASIKPVDKHAGILLTGLNVYPGGRIVIPNVTLKSLICTAFDISPWQLSGGDDWTDKTIFDVEAEPPSSVAATISLRHSWYGIDDPNLRLMLQSLLIDRFQLKLHTETKTGTIYLLEKNGKASPLQPARSDKLFRNFGEGYSEVAPQGGAWNFRNASMAEVADFLSTYVLHAVVLDKTGLAGTFDFRSKSQPDFSQKQQDFGASLLSGLGEIGLKLKRGKGVVKYFVIDQAEQPSPN